MTPQQSEYITKEEEEHAMPIVVTGRPPELSEGRQLVDIPSRDGGGQLFLSSAVRPSVLRRESFLVQFAKTKGPPQITLIMMLIAIGFGCTIGVVPAVMADRFAILQHGYPDHYHHHDDPSSRSVEEEDRLYPCSMLNVTTKPPACFAGSADAQSAVATSNLVSNVFTFVTSSLIGSLSDEYGRKVLLVIGLVFGMMSPLMLVLIQLIPSMSPWWYYGCHAATGLVNWIAVALSALADVLPPKFRAPGIGLLLAGFMLGISLSPILAFFLTHLQLSLFSFFTITMGVIATIFLVPETLPAAVAAETRTRRELQEAEYRAMEEEDTDERRRMDPANGGGDDGGGMFQRCRSMAGLGCQSSHRHAVRRIARFLWRPIQEMSILNRDSFFRLISLLALFSGMVSSGDQVLLVYYLEDRLDFTTQDVSIMFFIIGIMGLLAQGVVLKPLNDRLGEKWVVAVCFAIGAVDNTLYGLARNKATIFAAVAMSAFTGMAFPTISAIKSNNVAVTEQGRIQGALYSLSALASGVGPILLRFVHRLFQSSPLGPGVMFIFAGCLYWVAVIVACALPSERANAPRDGPMDQDADDDSEDGGGIGGGIDHRPLLAKQVVGLGDENFNPSTEDSYGSIERGM